MNKMTFNQSGENQSNSYGLYKNSQFEYCQETAAAAFCPELFSLPRNGSEGNSDNLHLLLFQGTEFRVVFSSAEGLGREFREFASNFVPRNEIPSCFLFHWRVWKGISKIWFYFCSTERNSELFSLLLKGSERNSENFLFRGTAGIPSEISICSVYSVFRGIIFLSEIPSPTCGPMIRLHAHPLPSVCSTGD